MSRSPLRAEFALLLHVRGLRLMVALLALLAVVATLSGVLRQADAERAVAELRTQEQQLRTTLLAGLERADEGAAPVAARPGALGFSVLSEYVVLQRAAAAPLATGIGDLLPDYYRFDAHAAYLQQRGGNIDNPLRLAVGGFDLAFVLVFVVPVLVIALSYDVLSREKELGVMALACAQGTSPRHYVIRKLLARGTVIVVAAGVSVLLAFAILSVAGAPADAATMLAWTALTIAYALVWYALAALINAFDKDSATNGVLLADIWLLLVVIVPAIVGLTATSLFPAPSRVDLTTELREAAAEAEERAAAAREQYFFDHPDLAGGDADQETYYRAVAASEQGVATSIDPAVAEFDVQARRQSELVARFKFLSPALAFNHALAQLAGNDRPYHDAFRQAAFGHHERWRSFFVTVLHERRLLTPADWGRLPEFGWQPPAAATRAAATLPTLAVLLLLSGALLFAALLRFRRYSPIQN
jgi:ABC-2 type transport system permease protein